MQSLVSLCYFIVDAVAGDGFCFKKINSKTGGCKKSLSINGNKKSQKVDCCSSGGAGWSLKKKDKANCEHCSTSVPGYFTVSSFTLLFDYEVVLPYQETTKRNISQRITQ